MTQIVTLEISDKMFSAIQKLAEAAGVSPEQFILGLTEHFLEHVNKSSKQVAD